MDNLVAESIVVGFCFVLGIVCGCAIHKACIVWNIGILEDDTLMRMEDGI